jgi:hypothetical protein
MEARESKGQTGEDGDGDRNPQFPWSDISHVLRVI